MTSGARKPVLRGDGAPDSSGQESCAAAAPAPAGKQNFERFFWIFVPQGVNIDAWSPPEQPAMERSPRGAPPGTAVSDAEALLGIGVQALQRYATLVPSRNSHR